MLNHWDDDLAWKGGGGGGRAAGELLAAGGMYAAPEQMSHAFTSFLKSGAEIGGKTGAEYLAAGGVHPHGLGPVAVQKGLPLRLGEGE